MHSQPDLSLYTVKPQAIMVEVVLDMGMIVQRVVSDRTSLRNLQGCTCSGPSNDHIQGYSLYT